MNIRHKLIIPAVGLWVACHTATAQAESAESIAVPVAAPAVDADTSVAEKSELTAFTEDKDASSAADKSASPDTLSVDFPDEDIRSVLRNVADLFELNIVVPDALSGRTSIKLRDVTWRQLYRVVLAPFGYTFVEEGNIIKIVSQDSLMQEAFVTESLIMVNVPANSVESILRPMLSPARAATEMESARAGGSLVVNTLANEIIITDQPVVIRRMVETAKRMDVEPRQVVIETKFVEITKTAAKEVGVKLAGTPDFGGGSSATNGFINSLGGTMPAALGAAPLPNNIVLNGNDFSALISMLNSSGGTRIVSNPNIVAVNGSKSEITVGRDLQTIKVTQQQAVGGGNNTITAEAGEIIFEGVTVEITPQITSSKLVALQLKTLKTEAEEFTFQATNTVSPVPFYNVRKRQGSLNMILSDGQTAAIGGLLDRREITTKEKVPVLGDMPVLGALFRRNSSSVEDSNLIIFITASILEPSKTTYRNLATRRQINDLELTDRDIRGVSYQVSAEEEALYDAIKELRQKRQEEELRKQLQLITNPPQAKSAK